MGASICYALVILLLKQMWVFNYGRQATSPTETVCEWEVVNNALPGH